MKIKKIGCKHFLPQSRVHVIQYSVHRKYTLDREMEKKGSFLDKNPDLRETERKTLQL